MCRARLYLMREIYIAGSDARARAEAHPWLPQYRDLWHRYTQFTHGGRLPDSYDFWRKQAPMLHAMSFEEIVANSIVLLGGPEAVANAILHVADQVDLMGLALIFKLGAMSYDMVERSMRTGAKEVMTRIRCVRDGHGALVRATQWPPGAFVRSSRLP